MFVANEVPGALEIDKQVFIELGVDIGRVADSIELRAVASREDHAFGQGFTALCQKLTYFIVTQVKTLAHLDRGSFVIKPKREQYL